MPSIPQLNVSLTHTGLHADGRPNPNGILIKDINVGHTQQNRKLQAYIPAFTTVELPFTEWVVFSFLAGDIHGFINSGQLTYVFPFTVPDLVVYSALTEVNTAAQLDGNLAHAREAELAWTFSTADSGTDYLGGFYQFGALDNAFSPAITMGDVNQARAAHFFIVTGATTVDEVSVTVTGTFVDDSGASTPGTTVVITVPSGTPPNTYFETPAKWNGQVAIETTGGTAIACNYGMAKYHDHGNSDFEVVALEALWISTSGDSTSDIALIHHKATGWAFNSGAPPTPPAPLVSRSGDFGLDVKHVSGEAGAWKRTNLSTIVRGADSEGVLWAITSGSAGIGAQSFRILNLGLTIAHCLLPC